MKPADKKRILAIIGDMERAKDMLEEIAHAMRESIDEKSDKWRESEKGEAADNEATAVEEAASNVESALDSLGNIEGLTD